MTAYLAIRLTSSPSGSGLEKAGNRAVDMGSTSNAMSVTKLRATVKFPITTSETNQANTMHQPQPTHQTNISIRRSKNFALSFWL